MRILDKIGGGLRGRAPDGPGPEKGRCDTQGCCSSNEPRGFECSGCGITRCKG